MEHLALSLRSSRSEISKIDVSSAPIDMSLRLWSDEVALASILDGFGQSRFVHVRGEPVPPRRGAAPRIATRHYGSSAHERSWRLDGVDAWMRPLLQQIRGDDALVSMLRTGRIEGTVWIAMFGATLLPMPTIDSRLVQAAASLGLSIFVENYTDLKDGNPSRRWFRDEPASVPRARTSDT